MIGYDRSTGMVSSPWEIFKRIILAMEGVQSTRYVGALLNRSLLDFEIKVFQK